ncbi:MAG: hypothetical protein KF820_01540 [Candidatus Paracaedibacteraceae bacterium]|jgi:hypothetical protein|nr:hypothetical protein [Betaproteobacteria bacterium]MBM4211598.1 hypothetical protein [Gammaproteobacteria bacterium]MBX3457030.1 hypothetical protein [Candidatus Paracaedibacteraceae bacterium]
MPNDLSQRGYKLPHPNNIASQDVVRIRETIIAVDADVSSREAEHKKLKEAFDRFTFETFLNLWSNHDNS